MLFFIWGFTSSGWPWFVIPLGASLAIVAFLFYRYKVHCYPLSSLPLPEPPFQDDNYSFARVPGAADAPATPAPSGAAGYENL